MKIKDFISITGQRITKGGAYIFGGEAVNLVQKVVSKSSKFCVKTTSNYFDNRIERTKKETEVINQKLDGWQNFCVDETNADLTFTKVIHKVGREIGTVVQATQMHSDAMIEIENIKLNEARKLNAIRQIAIAEGLDLEVYSPAPAPASAPAMLPTQQMIANAQSGVKSIGGAEAMGKPESSSAFRCNAGTYRSITTPEKLSKEDAILSRKVQSWPEYKQRKSAAAPSSLEFRDKLAMQEAAAEAKYAAAPSSLEFRDELAMQKAAEAKEAKYAAALTTKK